MSKFTGIYRGAVHDINDPESRGRIRALVPAVLGDAPSGWAEPALSDQPDTPNWSVGDRVWLLFDGGDINRPVYMSRLEVKTGDLSPEVAASIENAGGPTSDGFAPPQVANLAAAGGIETLFLSWDAVANLDPVWYDVYVGTAASFVRDSTTLAATIEGTVVSLPRAAGTYYAVVVASDADGPGPVSAEVSTVVEAPFDSAALEVRLDANDVAVNSRTRTVVAAARPTGLTADDRVVWVDSDGGFRSEFWDGTAWGPWIYGSEALADAAITETKIALDAVTSAKIAAAAVTGAKIAAGAVDSAKIADAAVTAVKIGDAAVVAAKIAAGAVDSAKITDGAVVAAKIGPGAVTEVKISDTAVTAPKIATGAVVADKIAAGAVTANKLSVIPGGGNLLTNSGMEGSPLPFKNATNTTVAQSPDQAARGTKSLAMTAVAAGNMGVHQGGYTETTLLTPVMSGRPYMASVYVRAAVTSRTARIDYGWVDAAGTLIGAYTVGSSTIQDTSTGWTRLVQSLGIAPANAAFIRIIPFVLAAAAGEVHYLDLAQIEEGDIATSWAPAVSELLPGTILTSHLATDAVTADKIAAGAVTASEIAAGAVAAGKIAAGAVTATEIAAGAVVAGKIAAGAVTATEIAADAVTADNIAAGAVTASEIAAGAVIADKIAAGAVIADKVAAGAIVADKIATNAVTSVKIAASAVIADKIAAGAVIADKLDVATVADNSAVNGTFQELRAGDSTMPKYFVRGGWSTSVPNSAGCAIDTTVFETSPQSVKLTTGASPNDHPNFRTDTAIPVVPGETWFIGVRAKASVAMGGLYVRMMNQNGGEVNQAIENRSVTTAWADYSGTFTIPAGMTTMRVFVLKHNSASGSSLWVDKIYIQRVGASVRVADGTVEAAKIVAGAVNGTHINASYAYLGEVSFDQMTGGNITNAVTLSSLLSTRADEFSAGGEMDQVSLRGFGPPAAAGEEAPLIFEIPFDGSRAFFEGDVEARNFTSREGANIYGIANYVKADGEFKLDAGTTPSNSSPAVSQSVSSVVLQTNVSATVGWAAEPIQFNISQCFGFNWSDSLGGWLTNQIRAGGTLVWLITKTGAISLHTSYQYLSVVSSLTHPSGSMIYMDGYDVSGEGNLSRWTIRVRWSNGERSVAFNRTDTRADSKFHPTLGLDFQGNIRVAEQSGGNIIIRTFSIGSSTTNPSLLATTTSSGIWNGANSGVGSIECGPFDFADAANHHVIVPRRAVPGVMVFTNGSPTSEPKFNWKTPTDVIGISMDYHVSNANTGTGWWALGNDNRLYKFNSDTKFLSDTATTGQVTHVLGTTYATETAETAVGTEVKFEFNRRWHATVTAPILVAPATRHGVYLVKGSNTAVASSSMIRQGYTATGSRVFAMHTPIYTGSAPGSTPTNGVYPLSVAARLVSTESATPLVDIKGDGSWRLGPLSGSTSGALTVPVVGRTAMTYQSPATSGSIYYKVFDLGNAKMVSITSALGGSFSTTAQTVVTSANGIPAAYRPDNIENGHIRMSVGGVVGHLLIQTDGSIQVQSSAGGGVAQGTCTYFV